MTPGAVLGAEQLDRDVGLDLDVELDLLEVEMDEVAANRVALLLLDHDRNRARPLDLDVDQGTAVDEDVADRASLGLKGAGIVAAAVDDAGDEPLAAQAAARARAEIGARLGFQGCAVGCHAAAEDREVPMIQPCRATLRPCPTR